MQRGLLDGQLIPSFAAHGPDVALRSSCNFRILWYGEEKRYWLQGETIIKLTTGKTVCHSFTPTLFEYLSYNTSSPEAATVFPYTNRHYASHQALPLVGRSFGCTFEWSPRAPRLSSLLPRQQPGRKLYHLVTCRQWAAQRSF